MIGFKYTSRGMVRVVVGPLLIALLAATAGAVAVKRHNNAKHDAQCEHTSEHTRSGDHASIKLSDAKGKENLVPLLVIGSGPAGLTAALYGRRGGLKTIVIEGNEPGGLLTKTTHVENWPGDRSILGPDLIKRMRDHAKDFGVEFVTDLVESIDTSSWPYRVVTENDRTFYAMSIVIATGAQPRKLNVPGEETYWGRGVTSCAICDAPFFKDKDVVVVGGGDSSVEEAFQLLPYVKSVTLLVRKDAMRAAASSQARLKTSPKITIRYNVELHEVVGNGSIVTGVALYDTQTKTRTTLPIDGVFLAVGHDPNSVVVKGLVAIDDAGYIKMQECTQKTSVEGIFAAGEVEDKRYKQAIVSAGRGASAALDALNFLGDIGYMPGVELPQPVELPLAADEPDIDDELAEIASQRDLEAALMSANTPVLLDFYTEECVSCKHMMPAVANLAHKFQDRLRVFKVDANQAIDLVKLYDIRRVPTFMLLADDKRPITSDKISSTKELVSFVEEHLTQ